MIQKVEFIKFNKKPYLNNTKIKKTLNDKKNYSLKKAKEYSQLYIEILNSNKSSNINRIKSTANINITKNKEKQINLFDSIDYNRIYSSQNNINNSSSTNKVINQKKKIKLDNNTNNKICSKKKNKNKKILISNKTVSKIEKKIKNNFNSKDKESNFNNQRLRIPFNKSKHLIKSRNLKKSKENELKNQTEKVTTKIIILTKEKPQQNQIDEIISYNKSKQILKNNIKIRKVDILNDNKMTLESNKEDNKLNYIFTKKLKKNYEIKLQKSPKFGTVSQKIKKMNKALICNKAIGKIKKSSNTIDSYKNKNNIKTETGNKILNKELNKENSKKRKSFKINYTTDNSRKLSNNKTEMNTMNSTRLIDIQPPFELNRNSVKLIKSNSLRQKKKNCLNKSAKIRMKIKQSFKNKNSKNFKEENFMKNIKYINLNVKNKPNSKRIVNIKIKNVDGLLSDEGEKIKPIYPVTDSEYSLLEEKSNNYRRRFYSVRRREISLSKERDKKRENSTMRNNEDIDNAEKKLSTLVRDFHNNLNDFKTNLSFHKSKKLIDRIRMKKKLNLM